jgi:sulfur carrier protein ThiS
MKISINLKPEELPEGARFSQVVELIERAQQDEPMFKHHQEKSGEAILFFVLNGKVVRPEQYDSLALREGDQIRWFLPYAGG